MIGEEEIRRQLVEGGLLSADTVDSYWIAWKEATGGTDSTADDFVDWLTDQKLITEFQGEAILAGHTGPFLLGLYRVYEHIAPGRLGGFYRAKHDAFQQPVSLKIFPASLKNDPEKLARMGREARIFSELDHPNVPRSYQVGCVGDIYYLALEDLQGETLAARLERDQRIEYGEACRIIRDTAKGLNHLHRNEVIHRDLRPANIWITDTGVPKVIEFGAARDAYAEVDQLEEGAELTKNDTVIGQYDYMAPEQATDLRDAGPPSDIYALGCVLYHCLTGRPPFVESNPIQLVLKHAREEPAKVSDLVSDVPSPIDDTLSGMLSKDPNQRFHSAEQVAFALDQYVPKEEDEPVAVVPVSQQYLDWVQSQQGDNPHHVSEDSVGISPELTDFLSWISRKKFRRRRRILQ